MRELFPTIDQLASPAPHVDVKVDEELACRYYRLLKIGTVALLALTCAVPLALNLVDPDLWGHVQYGQDWLAEGRLPRTASHTYTAQGHPWINHENAAELLFALGFAALPVHVMLVLKCAWGMAILAAMARNSQRRGVSAVGAWAFMLLVAANLQAFFPMRPQLLSFALFSIALVCLERGFPEWPQKKNVCFAWLCGLPVVFVAWVNSHGAFAAGIVIIGAVLLGRMIELGFDAGRRSLPSQLKLAAIGLACLFATLANPYGWQLHRWLANSLGSPRPEITEWAPPSWDTPVFWPFVTLLAASAASWSLTHRRRDWSQIAVFALVAWQASLHLRHISLLALMAGFWLPPHFTSAIARLRPDRQEPLPTVLPSRWLRGALLGGVLTGMVLQSTALSSRLSDFPVPRENYPVDALQYMADHRLRGKLVVSFNWAQYAISALAPHIQVAFDGRFRTCYPQEIIDMHFDFLLGDHGGLRHRSVASGPLDPTRTLDYGSPDLVLLDRRYQVSVEAMQAEAARKAPQWALLYRDPVAELWGRRAVYDDPRSPRYLPLVDRAINVRLQTVRFQWPALPDDSLWEEIDAGAGVAASGAIDAALPLAALERNASSSPQQPSLDPQTLPPGE